MGSVLDSQHLNTYTEKQGQYKTEDVYCFIFSWNDYYKNAQKIESDLSKVVSTSVINSSEVRYPHWVNLSTNAYFNEQMINALDIFLKSDKKLFFHIQSDVTFNDWQKVLNLALDTINKYDAWIYAPYVENLYRNFLRTYEQIEANIEWVNTVDETVWMVDRELIEIFFEDKINDAFTDNFYGWGYDKVFALICLLNKKKNILDYRLRLNHPKKQNYDSKEANKCFRKMLSLLPNNLHKKLGKMEHNPEKFFQDVVLTSRY